MQYHEFNFMNTHVTTYDPNCGLRRLAEDPTLHGEDINALVQKKLDKLLAAESKTARSELSGVVEKEATVLEVEPVVETDTIDHEGKPLDLNYEAPITHDLSSAVFVRPKRPKSGEAKTSGGANRVDSEAAVDVEDIV
jgi:hypothetical protein